MVVASGKQNGFNDFLHFSSSSIIFTLHRRYIFTIVSYLIGVFIFATIVGQVGNVITNRNANRLEFERLLDGAKTYMRHHKVSEVIMGGRERAGGLNCGVGLLPLGCHQNNGHKHKISMLSFGLIMVSLFERLL